MLDQKTAILKARQLLKQHSFKSPPVNIFDICRREGIHINYFEPNTKTADAVATYDAHSKTIYLNIEVAAERQAFIIAHVLGHYFLGHDIKHSEVLKEPFFWTNLTEKDRTTDSEFEANLFAMELLMPSQSLNKVRKDYGLTDTDVTSIKRLFGVPRPVAEARLGV